MKKTLLKSILFTAFVLFSILCIAQPPGGGGGFPGGRPPGGRPPGGRPPFGRDGQWGSGDPSVSVKPKKKVREGDTFQVVGILRDAESGEFLSASSWTARLSATKPSMSRHLACSRRCRRRPLRNLPNR